MSLKAFIYSLYSLGVVEGKPPVNDSSTYLKSLIMKLSHAWLFSLLPLSGMAFAAPAPLLKVVVASPTLAANSNSNTCTLDDNGQVTIEHTVKLSPSGPNLKSKEIRTANVNANGIKTVIAVAAQGKITGTTPVVGSFKHQYFAFQNSKKTFLLDKVGDGLFNDSPAVKPLTDFIDSVCGDLSLVAYQDSAKAKFSEVILATGGVKAAIDVCSQTHAGFGTPGSAEACDGMPSGDPGVFAALDYVNKMIAATPPADARTAFVTIAQSDATHLAITATAVNTNGLNSETYILNGTYYPSGYILWTVAPYSTCKVVGIC
jgi:type IV pilus assembly protein PilA